METSRPSTLKKILKKAINFCGYDLQKVSSKVLIKNQYKTVHKKNALLSFITWPFLSEQTFKHTVYTECLEISKILSDLGFNVDIVDYDNETEIDYEKYELIFGFGEPMEKCFYSPGIENKTTIFYGNGCFQDFSNTETLKRTLDVFHKKGKYIPQSARLIRRAQRMQTMLSTGLIILGNEFTAKTYLQTFESIKIRTVGALFYKTCDISLQEKKISEAKYNFLWFGSNGAIHKGLDLLLEVFKKRPDINLHICATIEKEQEFSQLYQDELENYSNIKKYGFIDLRSEQFKYLMNTCAFSIFPSASEGGCVSVITTMGNGGLIPIVSSACGIDVDGFGLTFDELKLPTLENFIDKAIALSDNEVLKRSKEALHYALSNHSLANFSDGIKESMLEFISYKKLS